MPRVELWSSLREEVLVLLLQVEPRRGRLFFRCFSKSCFEVWVE